MDKEYVPYDLSEKLKHIGFNEPCSAMWQKNKKIWYCYKTEWLYNYQSVNFTAPLWQQAFEWILKEYHLDVRIVQQTMKWSDFSIHRIFHSDEDEDFYFRSKIMKRKDVRTEALKKVIEVIENEN